MRRHLEPVPLDHGTWLRLDCGHPAPVDIGPDDTAECVRCGSSRRVDTSGRRRDVPVGAAR